MKPGVRRREPGIRHVALESQTHGQGIDLQARRQTLLVVREFDGVETLGEEVPANSVLLVGPTRDGLICGAP
jgi:hypothetical protein